MNPEAATSGAYAHELAQLRDDRDRLAQLLLEAEQRQADLPLLQERIAELEQALEISRRDTAEAEQVAQQLDQMLMYGRRALRYVRPMVKPLRQARRRLRS